MAYCFFCVIQAYEKAFITDWARLEAKEKFISFLDRESKKYKSKLSTEEVQR